MNATDFILSSLEMISKAVPAAGIRYAYDTTTNFHIIEVYPESIRRGDEEYMEMECNLWKDFHDFYPQEDILISEVDDTNDMSNLIYDKKPYRPNGFCFDERISYNDWSEVFSCDDTPYYSDDYSLAA